MLAIRCCDQFGASGLTLCGCVTEFTAWPGDFSVPLYNNDPRQFCLRELAHGVQTQTQVRLRVRCQYAWPTFDVTLAYDPSFTSPTACADSFVFLWGLGYPA